MIVRTIAYVDIFYYLCIVKKDDIITLLGAQLKVANEQLAAANSHVSALTSTVGELTERIKNLEDMLTQKGIALDKQTRISKALGSLVSGKKNEKQNAQDEKKTLTLEQYNDMLEKRRAKIKARGNNGAKRDEHLDMETVYVDVEPDVPSEMLSAMRLIGVRECIRYSMVPLQFTKTVFRIKSYTDGETVYQGKTPRAIMPNSTYDPSVVAGIMELRYIYSMPVERIVDYCAEHGFNLKKPTANKLLKRGSEVLRRIYEAIGWTILQQSYVCLDETYHKVLLEKKAPDDKGVKKGYLWGALSMLLNLYYLWYDDGSRSEEVLFDKFSSYCGFLQSDAFTGYKKLESNDYPDIVRIACLQHIKRKFIECGENDKFAMKVVRIINKLYEKEHKHKIGEKGWTAEKNLEYRQKYAPPILIELKNELESMRPIHEQLPKSDLGQAVGYALNEFNAVCDIFKRGDTNLDNNAIERCNRYVSLSRRNSLFFGSHAGAKQACILYTIAISCRLNNVNLFEYIQDVIDKTAGWDDDTPLEHYRNLLPDKWVQG